MLDFAKNRRAVGHIERLVEWGFGVVGYEWLRDELKGGGVLV